MTIGPDIRPQIQEFGNVNLPVNVSSKTAKSVYKTGVLEVTLTKVKEEKRSKGEPIKIE